MKITMCAAISSDGFIADSFGNGDFSSPADKQQFRAFLRSDKVDTFIIGRKTFEEFGKRIAFKPTFILSHQTNLSLPKNLNYALLGGAQTYEYFLKRGLVSEARITIEKNVKFGDGLALNFDLYKSSFGKPSIQSLSDTTDLLIYKKIEPNVKNMLFER